MGSSKVQSSGAPLDDSNVSLMIGVALAAVNKKAVARILITLEAIVVVAKV